MSISSANPARPTSRVRPLSAGHSVPGVVATILVGSVLLAVAAHIQVPFWPVKLSMQSFVVVAIGLVCGSRLAGGIVLAYLVEGAVGFPVFQSGAGLAYMAGPTGGYLVGFLLAAVLVGFAAERGALDRPLTALGVIALAVAAIYAPGLAWLAVLFGPDKVFAYGLAPFIPGEIFKAGLELALVAAARRAYG